MAIRPGPVTALGRLQLVGRQQRLMAGSAFQIGIDG